MGWDIFIYSVLKLFYPITFFESIEKIHMYRFEFEKLIFIVHDEIVL